VVAGRRLEATRQADRCRRAHHRHLVGQTDCTEQRVATVGLPCVRRPADTASDMVDVPSNVFILGARQRRTREDRGGADGPREGRYDVEHLPQVLDDSVRTAAAKVCDELSTIVHRPAGKTELTH